MKKSEKQKLITEKTKEKEGVIKFFEDSDFSGYDYGFYNIDKNFSTYKAAQERLSSGYINYDTIIDEEDFRVKAIKLLTRFSYTLFGFITGEKIPCVSLDITKNESFCSLTENFIQIGMQILLQENISRQSKVDILIALLFHEFFHKRETIADYIKDLSFRNSEDYYKSLLTTDYITKFLPKDKRLIGIFHNILEDRREERLGLQHLPGYIYYFEAKRKYAYFLHDKKVIGAEIPEALLIDYVMLRILLPERENRLFEEIDRFKTIALPKLKEELGPEEEENWKILEKDFLNTQKVLSDIKEYIDCNIATITSDSQSDIINEATNIYSLIPEKITEKLEKFIGKGTIGYSNLTEMAGLPNKNQAGRCELTPEQIIKINKAISEELKKIQEETEINKKSTFEKIENPSEFSTYEYFEVIEENTREVENKLLMQAKLISKNIFNKLGFLDSKYNRKIENFELSEGELDETELYSIKFNNDLFEEIEDIPGYSLDFGILLDESGSMRDRIEEAKIATLALILALKDNRHINLFVYGHTANENKDGWGNKNTVQIRKYYNTCEKYLNWKNIFAAKSRSNNADGFAIEKVAGYMKKSKSKNKVLIVVSDGLPSAYCYGDEAAINHVRTVVDKLSIEGITVIQICMANIENSGKMFKHFVPYERDGRFFTELKKILMSKLREFSDSI